MTLASARFIVAFFLVAACGGVAAVFPDWVVEKADDLCKNSHQKTFYTQVCDGNQYVQLTFECQNSAWKNIITAEIPCPANLPVCQTCPGGKVLCTSGNITSTSSLSNQDDVCKTDETSCLDDTSFFAVSTTCTNNATHGSVSRLSQSCNINGTQVRSNLCSFVAAQQ